MTKHPGPTSPQINATVMASAGTGKTWLLVSRLLRMLLQGTRADAILAITFTRKAAAEMQTRLSERLLALAAADEQTLLSLLQELGIEPDKSTLIRARGLYEELLQSGRSVRTTTFHAFCQEILRRFPLEADVPPGFELLENSGEQARAAWDSLEEQASQFPESDLARALEELLDYCGGLHGLKQALDAFLDHRGDWWAFTEEEGDPLAYARNRLQAQLQVDEDKNPINALFTLQLEQQLGEYCALLARHPTSGNLARLDQLSEARDPALDLESRFSRLREALLTKKDEPRSCKPSKVQAAKMGEAGQERFIELHDQLGGTLLRTLEQLRSLATLRSCSAWYLAGSELLEHFQRHKAEQRQLDFTDLEWRAYRLLHRAENTQWVQYKLDQRIDHLLVDEFQDTNPTQWRLLQPLLQEMASGSTDRQRSVFLVGDAKQSIYRFRRAEPKLFEAAHEWLAQSLDAQGFPLHTSWRSSPAIMQALNQLFGDDGPLAGILSDFTPHDTHLQTQWGSVTLLPLVDDPGSDSAIESDTPAGLRNPLHTPRVIEVDARYAQEGAMIAAEIHALVSAGTPVGTETNARPIHYGDIMILVRSRNHVGAYEQALQHAGIPYLGAERGTLLETLEVRDMVALLEVLFTPYNNLSLAQVLRSPIFDCSNSELAILAEMDPGHGNWFQRLCVLAQQKGPTRLSRAWEKLSRWHALAGRLPIHDLLDRVYSEGNVLARYQAAYPPHLRERSEANLTRFLELALAIDSGRYPSLGHFLERLGTMLKNSNEAPDESPTGTGSKRVRIMTIHASKGLEAPVVFLADSARSSGPDRPYRALVDWPPGAPRPEAFLLVGKKGQLDDFSRRSVERENKEEQREDANLLYVALTRARQHLYLTACAPRKEEDLGWYGMLRQALDPQQEIPLEAPCRLTSGSPPAVNGIHYGEDNEPAAVDIDQALSGPFHNTPQNREIAPSHHAGETPVFSPDGDGEGRRRGIAIHRILELLSVGQEPSLPMIADRVAQELGMDARQEKFSAWVQEAQRISLDPALQQVMYPSDGEAFNEVAIIYRQHGHTVHGVIDRLLLRGDEAWVIDYKTHHHATQENMSQLAEPYREQLHYYAEGVSRLWPDKRVRTFLLFTACASLYETQ